MGYLARGGRLLPLAVALTMLVVVFVILRDQLAALTLADVTAEFRSLDTFQLGTAGLFTIMSYLVLTQYDRLALDYAQLAMDPVDIREIAFIAFAIGNTVGVSALSGGAIRLRAYSQEGIPGLEVATIVAFCALTFTVGAPLLLGLALLLTPATAIADLHLPPLLPDLLSIGLIGFTLGYLVLAYLAKGSGRWRDRVPPLRIAWRQVTVACLDMLCVAAVLYCLLPGDLNVTYVTLLSAYMIALFLGLVSSVPGGLGVFEAMLLVLLPQVPAAELLAAVLVFRIIYFLLPLLLALVVLAARELRLA